MHIVGLNGDNVGSGVHGFLLSKGTFTTIDVPGSPFGTYALGINPRGDIVGYYGDSSNNYHGFLLHDGTFTTVYPPGRLCIHLGPSLQ